MPLADYEFSDLILSDNTAFLKGNPDYGHKLFPLPNNCDIKGLKEYIQEQFIAHANISEGIRDVPLSMRIEFQGINFRVADMTDIHNKATWFLRRLPEKVPTLKETGFPDNFAEWLLHPNQSKGLILITGDQASGKTTTASALLAEKLTKEGGHAVTFEYPSELPLHGKWGEYGFCFQTEIKGEKDLAFHVERAYRYASPNIIYIGEIKSKFAATEVLRMALSSSTQIVIATIHGMDLIGALEKLKNWATEMEGINASYNLANTLLGVFHTELKFEKEKKVLHVPHFLFVPFRESAISIRAKIREKNLKTLEDEMSYQSNFIKNSPNHKITI